MLIIFIHFHNEKHLSIARQQVIMWQLWDIRFVMLYRKTTCWEISKIPWQDRAVSHRDFHCQGEWTDWSINL